MSIIASRDKKVLHLLAQIQKIYPRVIDDLKSAGLAEVGSSALDTVLRSERPVLSVKNGDILLDHAGFWRDRVIAARGPLRQAIRAVGRIQLSNHPTFNWVGTGWLVDETIVVTARHVADVFARRTSDGYVFRSTSAGSIRASIDFLQEVGNPAVLEAEVTEVLYIEEADGPDLAFLRIQAGSGSELGAPIALSQPVGTGHFVAVVGYAAFDSRIPDKELMEELFGKTWEKKHLSPGTVMVVTDHSVEHDCSTLGGSAGAPLIDLESGRAVGLNFAGTYLKANQAVPAAVISERLQGIRSRRSRGSLPPAQFELRQTSEYVGDDQWNWAVWLEGSPEQLDAVESVEYTLHPTFPKPVRLVQERSTKFRLESGGWGSFLLRASIRRKDGSVVPATLDLDFHYPSTDEAAQKR
jgi:V8-like Glu-specific endopeptidase